MWSGNGGGGRGYCIGQAKIEHTKIALCCYSDDPDSITLKISETRQIYRTMVPKSSDNGI